MTGADILDYYEPPLDLEADMLFVAAAARPAPFAASFPGVRFLTLADRLPLVLWFSRVRSLEFGPEGARQLLDERTGFGYDELNVVAPTLSRSIFVPGIYATSGLTQRLGERYGMPKREVAMTFEAGDGFVRSRAYLAGRSEVSARLVASGRLLSRPFDWLAPWWSWPARFPSGSTIRAQILEVPRAQLAIVRGTLWLDEPWLAAPAPLWRAGVYVPGLRMRLPAPAE